MLGPARDTAVPKTRDDCNCWRYNQQNPGWAPIPDCECPRCRRIRWQDQWQIIKTRDAEEFIEADAIRARAIEAQQSFRPVQNSDPGGHRAQDKARG